MAEPSPSAATSPAVESRQRIDAEHRNLNALLAELVVELDPRHVESLLGRLHALLVGHFATEEAPEGLHEIVREHAPHRLAHVQLLFVEHREMLRRVALLHDEAAALVAGPLERLREQVEALATSLRAHEAVEDEIFAEAFYTDIGGRA
jgi:hypothetical protein